MSTGDEESTLQELVIIRRRGGESEAPHKGGVWKIAYADFMTAMMAFFLVMWLINATDKKVLTQVATYFNPLRLTDKSPTPRGLHDADTGAPGSENALGQSKVKDGTAKGAKLSPAQQKIVEEALFSDPYGTLEILAQQAAKARGGEPRPSATQDQSAAPARKPGEAFRDPFDPEARHAPAREIAQADSPQIADAPAAGQAAGPVAGRSAQPDTGKDAQQSQGKSERDAPVVKPGDAASSGPAQRAPAADSTQLAQADAAAKATMPADGAEKAGEGQPARELKEARDALRAREAREAIERAETAKLHEEIKQALNQLDPGASPEIDVTVTEEGLLISLTDKFDFGMFAIASAEPRPALVLVMEQIAKVLQTRPGQIIVRGHTDGRPFRSANYDNWRLSTARAHMANYMLVRGGLDEKRVERVEGHADRSLRVPADPEAAQNRRIELLLRRPKP